MHEGLLDAIEDQAFQSQRHFVAEAQQQIFDFLFGQKGAHPPNLGELAITGKMQEN